MPQLSRRLIEKDEVMDASPACPLSSLSGHDEDTNFNATTAGGITDEMSCLTSSDDFHEHVLNGDPRDWKYRKSYIEFIGVPDKRCKFPSNTNGANDWPEFCHVLDGTDFIIGRDQGTWIINDKDKHVSSTHLKIYSITYDDRSGIAPMVYCEDQLSMNGTYVNGRRIGNEESAATYGKIPFLLNDGDTVLIKPHWEFRFHQPGFITNDLPSISRKDSFRIGKEYHVFPRTLGRGEFGAVHVAVQKSTQRQVACKIIDVSKILKKYPNLEARTKSGFGKAPCWDDGGIQRQKIKDEVTILASLSNAHILNLRKAFYSNDMIYIFTDLATGGDLYSFVQARNCSLPDGQARIIAWQLLQAIKYIHSMGIVHRDIKPENVLLSNADWGSRVILTDFGFAKHLGLPNGRATSEVGTYHYMAPEVFTRALNGYTKAADLWSFGILISFMLTGHYEIAPEPQTRSFHEHLQEFFGWLDVREDIRESARAIMKALLVMDERKRLSAEGALDHQWFKEHHGTAKAMNRGWQRLVGQWKPRDPTASLIEDLQSRKRHLTPDTKLQPRKTRVLNDASIPQLPSLARHLEPRKTSHRREILDTLNGSPFLTDTLPAAYTNERKRKRASQIEIIDGRDMFKQGKKIIERQRMTRRASPSVDVEAEEMAIVTGDVESLLSGEDSDESLVALLDCSGAGLSATASSLGMDMSIQGPTKSQYFGAETLVESPPGYSFDLGPGMDSVKQPNSSDSERDGDANSVSMRVHVKHINL